VVALVYIDLVEQHVIRLAPSFGNGLLITTIGLIILLAVGIGMYRLIEVPARRALRAWVAMLVAALLVPVAPALAQGPAVGVGSACQNAGTLSAVNAAPLFCENGVYRWALPEDVPAAPAGGYTSRPDWFPPLHEVFPAGNPPECPVTGRVTLTHPVIRPADVTRIVPQALMIGDHVQPIDHGYIGITPLEKPDSQKTEADYVPVYAPADAEVIEVSSLGSPTSTRIVMAHGCATYSILMVVNRLSGALAHLQDDLRARGNLRLLIRVPAGSEIARQRDNPIDLSLHVGDTWLSGYAFPFSYAYSESWRLYTVDPWPYFSPDLAAFYESRMQRVHAPRWGRIDQDIDGTAAGSWYLAGTMGYSGHMIDSYRGADRPRGGQAPGKNTYAWSHLAIVRHVVQPGRWMFSTGWWQNPAGDPAQYMLVVPSGQPEPSALTAASGMVVFELWSWLDGPRDNAFPGSRSPLPIDYWVNPVALRGLVAMQVNADGSLSVEIAPAVNGQRPGFTAFSTARRTYRR
jgi:hypothetical protein